MIISRYLTKEITSSTIAITFVLMLVFMCNQIVRYLSYAASGKVGANVLLQLLGFEIPNLLALLFPLGTYLGIIFVFGRLYADNEMRVLQSSGFSTSGLMMITSGIALLVSIFIMLLTLWINPYIAAEKRKLILQSVATPNLINTIMPGQFQVLGGADKQRVVYIEKVDRNHNTAHKLFFADQKIEKNSHAITWNILSAEKGYQMRDKTTQDRYVVTTDGFRYEGVPGQNNYKLTQFSKYAVRIPGQAAVPQQQFQEAIPTQTLLQDYGNRQNKAELQWRISIPLSAFLLSLLAIPLSKIKPRQGRYSYLFPAILIYVIYVNMLFVARDWMTNPKWTNPLGMWWVHVSLVFVILLLFWLRSFNRKGLFA